MLVSACSVNVNRSSTASLETPEVIVTRASDDHQRSVESPSDLLWSTLSPADVFTTDNLRVPTRLPSSSSAPQVSISIISFYHSCEPSLATSVSNECSRKADILVVEIRPHQPLLCRLHWMKASERITYKVAVVAYKCQHGLAPTYLCGKLRRRESRRRLRSASSTSLDVQRTRLSMSVTERFLLQPLVCGTVLHRTSLLPPIHFLLSS